MSDNTNRYLLNVPCNGDVKFFTLLSEVKKKAAELQKLSEQLQKGTFDLAEFQKVSEQLQKRIESLENLNASITVAIEVPKEYIDYSNFEELYKVY